VHLQSHELLRGYDIVCASNGAVSKPYPSAPAPSKYFMCRF